MARIVIPQRSLAAGAQGNVATNRVAAATDRYFLTIQQISWPFTGGRAISRWRRLRSKSISDAC